MDRHTHFKREHLWFLFNYKWVKSGNINKTKLGKMQDNEQYYHLLFFLVISSKHSGEQLDDNKMQICIFSSSFSSV